MTITKRRTASLRWGGDVDLATIGPLRDSVTSTVADPGLGGLVIDLADVGFIDSTGLGLLVLAYNESERRKIDFTIRGASPRTRRLLHVTGLADVFTLAPTA